MQPVPRRFPFPGGPGSNRERPQLCLGSAPRTVRVRRPGRRGGGQRTAPSERRDHPSQPGGRCRASRHGLPSTDRGRASTRGRRTSRDSRPERGGRHDAAPAAPDPRETGGEARLGRSATLRRPRASRSALEDRAPPRPLGTEGPRSAGRGYGRPFNPKPVPRRHPLGPPRPPGLPAPASRPPCRRPREDGKGRGEGRRGRASRARGKG